jgi:DNA-binding response OmpR family regulator
MESFAAAPFNSVKLCKPDTKKIDLYGTLSPEVEKLSCRILLVEDDAELREIISDYFREKSGGSLQIDTARSGSEGRRKSLENAYDLVLLDVMLPGIDGFAICRELRKKSDVPIMFITAKHQENDRLHGYYLGCDDYITKPFSLAELYAKVTALIRRAQGRVRNELLTAGPIQLDTCRCTVTAGEKEILLAPIEFDILKILMENRGRPVSRETLIIRIWGYDFEGNDRVVDNHVKKLRKALGQAAGQIKTVFKKGYKLEGEP